VNITIASSGLGHVSRGIEAWAADLGRALTERGQNVTLCKGGGEVEAPFDRVIPCWRRGDKRTERLLRLLPRGAWRLGLGSGYQIEQTTFALNLLRHLRKERVDILHVQDPQVALIAQRARQLGIVKTRTILAHGTEEPLTYQRKITYLQHLAPWHLEESRTAGVWKPTWTAIPNFINTETFHPGDAAGLRAELNIPSNALVVLTAAAIKRHHKRIDYLLDEFAALRRDNPDAPLWLVVAGGWESDTDELVTQGQSRLGDRVRFLVRFPHSRMPELYRVADVFVLCSLKEMMPIALLEATASGLPCLVHNHPVVRWMIGEGGEAIDMAASGNLAASLHSLLDDADKRQRLGASARQHCLANFGCDEVLKRILAYYDFVHHHHKQTDLPTNSRLIAHSYALQATTAGWEH
jgi:glycosyltransferase involved in cell wall biosynthesis